MSLKHIIKHTESEIVFKCYVLDASGGSVDLSVQNDMTKSTQVYVAPVNPEVETDGHYATYNGSRVYISGIWWGLKKDKQLDITRLLDNGNVHSHYYLIGAGSYDFQAAGGFVDRTYANRDIRLTFDGPGHCIIRLRKEGWNTKVEPAEFGSYDNPNVVGS